MSRKVCRLLVLVAILPCCVALPLPDGRTDLGRLNSFAIQLQGLDRAGAVDRLAAAEVDLVVIDRLTTGRDGEGYPMRAVVKQLRASPGVTVPGKLCLAYVNVGQAESYRAYWRREWRAPERNAPGAPGFLLAPDPDGWASNYSVAFWDPAWRNIVFGGADSLVAGAIEEGFDGVMLDWVAGWEDPLVAAAAARAGVEPREEMTRLVRDLADRARADRPAFLVLLNGGGGLLEQEPALRDVVDGVVRESVSFGGKPSSDWDDPENADVPWTDTEEVTRSLAGLLRSGVAILTLDYASRPENRAAAEARARSHGFVPFVSRTPLDRLPRR